MILPTTNQHDDVIKWKHFPRYLPFVRGIHRSPVNSPHKGQWRGALMFTLIGARINGWVNNCEAGDLRHNRAHYDVIVMNNAESVSTACVYNCQYLLVVNCHALVLGHTGGLAIVERIVVITCDRCALGVGVFRHGEVVTHWRSCERRRQQGINLCMRSANERRRYNVTSSLIIWANAQNNPWTPRFSWRNSMT